MAYRFTIIDSSLDPLFNRVDSINDAGQIGGSNGNGFPGHLYSSFKANGYGALDFSPVTDVGYAQTKVTSFDNFGRSVGRVTDGSGNTYGAIDTGGVITAIPGPAFLTKSPLTSFFNGVNDSGVAVGGYYDGNGHEHGRVYNIATGVTNGYDVPGATSTVLDGINDAGDIVGTLFVAGTSRGFRLVAATAILTFVDRQGSMLNSAAYSINNEGQIGGQYSDLGGTKHGFIYSIAANVFTTIDAPGAASGMGVYGINDQGQAVGSYLDSGGTQHGFLANPNAGISIVDNPPTGAILSMAPGSTGLQANGVNAVTLVDRTLATTGAQLIANAGPDVLVSISSPDTLVGGAGNDTFFSGTAASTINLGGGNNIVVTSGDATVLATTGNDTSFASGGGHVISYGGSAGKLLIVAGSQDSTMVGGAGSVVAFAGTGHAFVFGGAGLTEFLGGSADSDFNGGDGAAIDFAGAGGGLITGGAGTGIFVSEGHTTITAGYGASQMYVGNGDVVSLVGGANNVVGAATGNVTLNGVNSTGNNLFLLGAGVDSVRGGQGSDVFYLGGGFGQITGGGGRDVYAAVANTGGLDIIHGFRPGTDQLVLNGFGASEAQTALVTQLNGGGSTTLNLTDGTKMTFLGVAHMDAGVFS